MDFIPFRLTVNNQQQEADNELIVVYSEYSEYTSGLNFSGKMESNFNVKHSNVNHTALRPTEGQLKWALLNQKRVALKVQNYVQHLYMCPVSVNDIPAYHFTKHCQCFDDIDDDEASNFDNSNHTAIRTSKGRRAMLYYSNLEYENRTNSIAANGFRYRRSTSDDESDQSTNDDELADEKYPPNEQTILRNNNMIYIPTTGRRKKFRRRRKKFQPRCSDPERVRRFKEAFQVALHSLEHSTAIHNGRHPTSANITAAEEIGTTPDIKRCKWVRPDVNDELMNLAGTYTVYGCSTVPKRQPSVHNPTITPGKAPLDRGATWLNLIFTSQTKKADRTPSGFTNGPANTSSTPDHTNINSEDQFCTSNSRRSILTPALRQHVADIAREIFSGERKGCHDHGDISNRSIISPLVCNVETIERDVTSFVDQFEEHLQLGSDSMIDCDDSDASSPRYPKFDPTVPIGGCSSSSSIILPVVTYDSDESKPNAWNESAIIKNMDDTFTIQELDSSFQCWNLTTTMAVADEVGHTPERTMNGSTDLINDEESRNVETKTLLDPLIHDTIASFSPTSANVPDQFGSDALPLSPLNLKHIVRLLPDHNNHEIHMIDVPVVSLTRVEALVPGSTLEDGCSIGNQQLEIRPAVPSIVRENEITNHEGYGQRNPAPMHSSIIRIKQGTNVCSIDESLFPIPPPQWSNHVDLTQQQPYHHHLFHSLLQSAGCGLYTERGQHFDVAREKRFML